MTMMMANMGIITTQQPINFLYSSFSTRMTAAGSAIVQPYDYLYNQLFNALRFKRTADDTTSYFSQLSILRIEGTYSKTAALQNLISSSFTATITNDHGSSFTAKEGLKGNGTNFHVNTGLNPSTDTLFTRNSASIGVFVLDDKSGDNNQEFGALKTGGSDGVFLRIKRSSANGYWADGDINNSILTTPFTTVLSGRGWFTWRRPSSGAQIMYLNGHRGVQTNSTSTAGANVTLVEFATSVNGTISSWVSSSHAAFWAGSTAIEASELIEMINRYFLYPLGNSNSSIKNRVHFVGDSMTGDEALANQAISVVSEYGRRTLSNLGTNWMGSQNGDANREVVLDTVVNGLLTILQGTILGESAGAQNTFKMSCLDRDVMVFFIGTNDLAFHPVTDANALMTGITTVYNAVKALGYKIIWIGAPDREAGFSGGQTTGNFATANADWRTQMLAIYTAATAVTNVWMNSDGNLFIDIRNNAKFSDATDTTYYNVDLVHLNTVGYDALADDLLTPAIQLF